MLKSSFSRTATVAGMVAALIGAMSCTAQPTASATPAAMHRLEGHHPCPDQTDATCAYLKVPLDRGGQVPGTLRLKVAMASNTDAPKGVLVLLAGGPGQPGVHFFKDFRKTLAPVLDDYRLVMIDQRGTGEGAIDCPLLQKEVGGTDTLPPSAQAVRECADKLGGTRDFYTTADTVADLDALRGALGARRWTLDGVSYGSFVGQQYALTHPRRTAKLVLDSVVPQNDPDLLYATSMRRSAWTLRTACAEQKCGFDPAKAVATVVRKHGNGVRLFNMLVIASIIDPKLSNPNLGILPALDKAAKGDVAHLNQLLDGFSQDDTPIAEHSAGLHAATLCADAKSLPWGDASAPIEGRDRKLRTAIDRMKPRDTWPFENKTAAEQGVTQTCLAWPPSRPMPEPRFKRLTMPVLLLQGDRDLSTPLSWAEEQAARTPRGKLAVIKGAGHSVQRRNPPAIQILADFLKR